MARKKKIVEEPKEEKPEPIMEREDNEPIGPKIAKFAKIVFGILVILCGLFLIWVFLPEFIKVIEGLVGVILILIGLIIAALGWLD